MTSNGDDFRQLDSEVLLQRIRSLNSKAGQMKMDLHDLAEGLPADFEQLPGLAAQTHAIFAQLDAMRRHLREQQATNTPT